MQTFRIWWWIKDEFLPETMRGEAEPDLAWDVEADNRYAALLTVDPRLFETGRVEVEEK